MSDIVKEMRLHGLVMDTTTANSSKANANYFASNVSELDFSGYGVFTPITVSSSTVFGNAYLERDQQRD